ncbi:MAG: ABC transporter ATP-binding protein [Clostridiales bacterium]|jgi:lipopolysaccharide transport system ATP-binding protein|nr:ABC transporter ATP-binding protein [Clostridiales bacterium]
MGEYLAIRVRNLGKKYRIGGLQEPYLTFRETIGKKIKAPFQRLLDFSPPEEFWALKDISFEIEQGEVVGIIGQNGAGKSTLLKILSRITTPTEGTVELHGRVGSLLEVGTGFHPELTGRENIHLSGSILGMKRREIDAKLDEIVKFSEIERFLDTPVKRYSSGMYVRLAFSVAAHLDPEILLIDEVLAVGDAQFQKKCLGKMGDIAKEGRTVLFVSHQMGSIAQLCTRAILFKNGRIVQSGPVFEILTSYMNHLSQGSIKFEVSPLLNNKDIALISAMAMDDRGKPTATFTHVQPITIAIRCRINKWINGAEIRISVRDRHRNVFTTDTRIVKDSNCIPEMIVAKVVIPGNLLRPETYFITLATYIPNQMIIDLKRDAFSITIIDGGSKYAASEGLDYGCVFVDCSWSIQPEQMNTKEI